MLGVGSWPWRGVAWHVRFSLRRIAGGTYDPSKCYRDLRKTDGGNFAGKVQGEYQVNNLSTEREFRSIEIEIAVCSSAIGPDMCLAIGPSRRVISLVWVGRETAAACRAHEEPA
jgi:hypothetical protein